MAKSAPQSIGNTKEKMRKGEFVSFAEKIQMPVLIKFAVDNHSNRLRKFKIQAYLKGKKLSIPFYHSKSGFQDKVERNLHKIVV